MKAKLVITILGFALSFTMLAQKEDCIRDFDYMVNKVKADYPGYNDKVTKATEKELADLEMNLRKKLAEHPDSCGIYLDEYVSWFKDAHLKIRYIWPKNRSKTANTPPPAPKIIDLNDEARNNLNNKKETIEGIWISHWGKIAIQKGADDKYYGIVIEQKGYSKNQLMFEFSITPDKQFKGNYFLDYNNFKPMSVIASLHLNDRILEIHDNFRFVRQSNSNVYDMALRQTYQPQYPNGRNTYPVATYLSDSTFFLRIPGFDDDLSEKLVKAHWKEIMSRPNLIIDIRGNGGGSDEFYQPLAKLLYTNPYKCTGIKWYASEGNLKNFEETLKSGDINNGDEGRKWIEELVKAMKQNIGGFVVHPMMGGDEIVKEDSVYLYPKKVGIIINEGNGSSAEQFLLAAKESKKVILFGNHNTAGVLDYSNQVEEDFPSGKFKFFWPMSRSNRLPDHPIDNIGIAPNVIIPFPETKQLYDKLDDWVYFVRDYLEYKD